MRHIVRFLFVEAIWSSAFSIGPADRDAESGDAAEGQAACSDDRLREDPDHKVSSSTRGIQRTVDPCTEGVRHQLFDRASGISSFAMP
jgi:hypothetical protein